MLEGQQIAPEIGFPPMPAVAAILSRYDRNQLAAFVTVAIDLMDLADGDPDIEIEDNAGETVPVIDDPEIPPEEEPGDTDLEETDCEDSFELSSIALGSAEGAGCPVSDPGGAGAGEDDEEDDPSGQCDEDGINTGSGRMMLHGQPLDGPGCIISDNDIEHDGGEPSHDPYE